MIPIGYKNVLKVNPLNASEALICTANQLTGFYMRATLALNGLNRAFPNFLFFTIMLNTIYNYHFTNITNTRVFNKQLVSRSQSSKPLVFSRFLGLGFALRLLSTLTKSKF